MGKAIAISVISFLFFIGVLCISLAQCASPECYHMVWGVVWDLDGDPICDKQVVMIGAQVKSELATQTNSSGIYSFNFYKDYSGDDVKIQTAGTMNILRECTAILKKDKALRIDFHESITTAPAKVEPTESSIVYTTATGDRYHIYGCQYLYSSCKPTPFEYVYLTEKYKPCEVCLTGSSNTPTLLSFVVRFFKMNHL